MKNYCNNLLFLFFVLFLYKSIIKGGEVWSEHSEHFLQTPGKLGWQLSNFEYLKIKISAKLERNQFSVKD